ncbi:NB-ARC domains-containing protein [Tanacetum coccineum]
MNANTIIYVEYSPMEEAWVLFKRVVGEKVETNANLEKVARKVVDGCGGLPQILQTVGKALKDEDNFIKWEKALDNIAKDETSDTGRALMVQFARLKLSYDYLESEQVKSVFLLCSMFPKDFHIPFERLAYYCVGLQIFTDLNSMKAARNKVQGAVKILKSSCLLSDGEYEYTTKMHDVVREVALLIASKNDNNFLVEARKNLKEWEPRIGSLESYTHWQGRTQDFQEGLRAGYELNIPHLKIVLIQRNDRLSEISNEVTEAMKEAEVIDFAHNNIYSLPKLLNRLTRLRMLNLARNRSLHDVAILGELKQLEILILTGTGITEIPHDIGKLVNLRLFHVEFCPVLTHIAPGKLSKLTFLNLYVPHICLFPGGDFLKRLKRFSIKIGQSARHPAVRKAIHLSVAKGLVKLQKLEIYRCISLKEVIWDGDDETVSGTGIAIGESICWL